jgi:hypothetical protein
VTIVDETEEDPFINIVLNIQELYIALHPSPIRASADSEPFLGQLILRINLSKAWSQIKHQKFHANPRRNQP